MGVGDLLKRPILALSLEELNERAVRSLDLSSFLTATLHSRLAASLRELAALSNCRQNFGQSTLADERPSTQRRDVQRHEEKKAL
jgi:hypothetical protein